MSKSKQRNTIAVSFRGDAHYKRLMENVATQLEVPVSTLLRQAFDTCFDSEIARAREFIAESDARKHQSVLECI